MTYYTEDICYKLQKTRQRAALTQKALGSLAGLPQSHISKVESNDVDLRVSSLAAIAHALGLELFLVPRRAVLAVRATLRKIGQQKSSSSASDIVETHPRGTSGETSSERSGNQDAEASAVDTAAQNMLEYQIRRLEAVASLVATRHELQGQSAVHQRLSLKLREFSDCMERATKVGDQIVGILHREKRASGHRSSRTASSSDA